jgi:hypothetical protein
MRRGETTSQGWDRIDLTSEERGEIERMRARFTRAEMPKLKWGADKWVLFYSSLVVSYLSSESLLLVWQSQCRILRRQTQGYGHLFLLQRTDRPRGAMHRRLPGPKVAKAKKTARVALPTPAVPYPNAAVRRSTRLLRLLDQ